MRRALHRAGWSLVTAGTFAIAAPVVAQTPPGAPTTRPDAGTVVSRADAAAQLEEMKVELAWLADAVTFPCHLAAHVEGRCLEVRGQVPSEAVRQRALSVARGQTALKIVDTLAIHPRPAQPCVIKPGENVRQAAIELLNASLGKVAKGLDVVADAAGQVTVSGSIGSYEEKLAVSRHLQRVAACSCVVNQLTVKPVLRNGKSCVLVSVDGRQALLADETSAPAASLERKPFDAPTQVSTFKPVASTSPAPADERKPSADRVSAAPAAQPAPLPAILDSALTPWSAPAARAGHEPKTTGTSRQPEWVPAKTTKAAGVSQAPQSGSVAVVQTGYPPSEPNPLPSSIDSKPVDATLASTQARGTVPATAAGLKQASRKDAPGALHATPREFTFSKPANFSPKPAAPAVKNADGYVTSGIVVFSGPEEALPVPLRLKGNVEAVCGAAARDVGVVVRSADSLQISLKVRSPADGQRLSCLILDMPELAPYKVDLKMDVVP